ncbi:Hypothetical protein ABZS17G119_01666 [Kosakonia cowanii]|jgi:hypothetical protein
MPDGGLRLIRPTKQSPARIALPGFFIVKSQCIAGWRLAPYPAYKSPKPTTET